MTSLNSRGKFKSLRTLLQWHYFNFNLLKFLLNITVYFMGFMMLWFGILQPAYYLFLNHALHIHVYAQTQIHLHENSLLFKRKSYTTIHGAPAYKPSEKTGSAAGRSYSPHSCSRSQGPDTGSAHLLPSSHRHHNIAWHMQLQRESGHRPSADLSWSVAYLQAS